MAWPAYALFIAAQFVIPYIISKFTGEYSDNTPELLERETKKERTDLREALARHIKGQQEQSVLRRSGESIGNVMDADEDAFDVMEARQEMDRSLSEMGGADLQAPGMNIPDPALVQNDMLHGHMYDNELMTEGMVSPDKLAGIFPDIDVAPATAQMASMLGGAGLPTGEELGPDMLGNPGEPTALDFAGLA